MYRSPPVSKDMSSHYPSPSQFGSHGKDDSQSDPLRRQQQQEMSSGLVRFRSAPSSLLGELCEDFVPAIRVSSPDMETMLERFLTPDHGTEIQGKPAGERSSQFAPQPQAYSAEEVNTQKNVEFSSASQMMYHSQQQQQQKSDHSSVQSPYEVVGSMAMAAEQIDNGSVAASSNLIRHGSSPAGLFSHLNEDRGYDLMGAMDGFRNENSSMGDAANSLKGQISFSSRQNSIMSQISEMVTEAIGAGSPQESSYNLVFPVTSWEQTSMLSDNSLSGYKRGTEEEQEGKIIDALNPTKLQNGEVRNYVTGLTHQLSLPNTSSEMAAMENFLQFQDTVPRNVRAKRGCATHPRSIAERVRRTKISERMRKLEELVPNMDKQTNTADMLDLAVDYIKYLQKQVKVLTESRVGCLCSSSEQKPHPN